MLPRIKSLYEKGLFEICGAGEAIVDVNMCSGETLCRNLASGVRYCRDVLGMPPLLANHADGFGSSAQFPQVIRSCGLPGIQGLSYSLPDNQYWRGLDGSTVLFWQGAPGRGYFYDHCYHEPCRVCRNLSPASCPACQGTGFDLPQNFYPPFEPVADDQFRDGVAVYNVCSEEMLPPADFTEHFRQWEMGNPEVTYRWGTPRFAARLWESLAAAVDNAPVGKLSSRVENNPVLSGCLVSRIRIKQLARQLEAEFYGWEKAVMLSSGAGGRLDRGRWEKLFLELPLAFFHDSVTGTHQDEAYQELMNLMSGCIAGIRESARDALGVTDDPQADLKPGSGMAVFSPHASVLPGRALLPPADWRSASPMVAVDEMGGRHPIVLPLHRFAPPLPSHPSRLINAVGSDARTRPETVVPRLEMDTMQPLAWTRLRLEAAAAPQTVEGRMLRNAFLELSLGDHGVTGVCYHQSGLQAKADRWLLGELLIEEDEGDPWGTRKPVAFRKGLGEFTRFRGAARFDGYQEAWYSGRYEPNLRFGREEDPKLFGLEWLVTVRLLDAARRVDFSFEIFWKSADRRIRVAFPTQAKVDTGFYSIPAGWLRRDRHNQQVECLWSPNGDWPALHFVATESNETGHGWAVVNHGTPSARIEDGAILMSVLRSPGFGHCLERYGQTYPMPTSGIRDGGWHQFEFQLLPYGGEAKLPELALQAAALNQPAPCVLGDSGATLAALGLGLEGADVELQAAKPSFSQDRKDAVILRLVNHADTERHATVRLPEDRAYAAWECDLLETPGLPIVVTGHCLEITLRPFEIRSLIIKRNNP
jgi:alpha-mannosidase